MIGVEGMKDSFILYTSFYEPLKSLSDEQLGRLFRAIFEFNLTGKENVDVDIQIAFAFIKNQLILDGEKYEEVKKKKAEAGKLGMQNRWKKNITNDNKNNSVKNVITDVTKITDNDNVNDNVNVIKEKNIKKRKVFQKPTIEEIKQYCTDRNNNVDAEQFYDFYESKGWKVGKEPMKDWKACIRTWEKNTKSVQRNEKNKEKNIKNCESREYEDYDEFYDNDFF